MMPVLCGANFSELSKSASLLAAQLAKLLGEPLVLVHALEPWTLFPLEAQSYVPLLDANRLSTAEQQLATQAAALSATGVKVEWAVEAGFADEVLRRRAKESAASLVVVGSASKGPIETIALGSVAERLSQTIDVPVLVLRENAQGLSSALTGQSRLRVLVATDESLATDSVITWLRKVRTKLPCDLEFVHCYWPPAEYERLGLAGPRALFELDPEVERTSRRDLAAKIGSLPGEGTTNIHVEPAMGAVGANLALVATRMKCDLVVVGTHHRSLGERVLHGSVSRQLVRANKLPTLCIPHLPTHAAVPELRRVLVTTDLSELGNRAIPYAYSLLRGGPGEVELVHVLEAAVGVTRPAATDAPKTVEAVRQLKALIPAEAGRSDVVTTVHVLEAPSAAEAIAQTAARLGVDALCMSSHGRGGVSRAVAGSVAQAVLTRAERPVFVVRAPA